MTEIRNSPGPAKRGDGEFALERGCAGMRLIWTEWPSEDSVLREAPWALRVLAADSHHSCHLANIVVTTVTKVRKFSVFLKDSVFFFVCVKKLDFFRVLASQQN